MSVPFSDFYDLIMPEVGGCTTDFVDLHLKELARDFCHRTRAWTYNPSAADLIADQAAYAVPLSADSELVSVKKLTVNDVYLWEDVEEKRDYYADSSAYPKYERHQPPFSLDSGLTTITLFTQEIPSVSVVGGLVMSLTLKPSSSATTLPDFLKTQYSEAMRYGVLARLMSMGKKPWTDRALAVDYMQKFKSEMNFAAYQVQVGNTRQRLRVKKHG
jgi:hypothetical protein